MQSQSMKGKNTYLENLKSINIQNTNTELFSGFLYGFIYCLFRQRKTKKLPFFPTNGYFVFICHLLTSTR